jgi:beta-lactamase regulating signal transducer with metallopeptidase domain
MSEFLSHIHWNVGWSAALGVVIFLLSRRSACQRRPALMHVLWFGVLLRLIVPAVIAVPVLPVTLSEPTLDAVYPVPLPQKPTNSVVPDDLPPPKLQSMSSPEAVWMTWPVGLALNSWTGTVTLLAICFTRNRRLSQLLSRTYPVPQQLLDRTRQLAHDMRLSGCPVVRVVEGLATPSLSLYRWRATIMLPRHLLDKFDDEQWSCILSHELAHFARGDGWFNLMAAGIVYLFWWNPVAWWAWREMRACQEASCDALALARQPASRRLYAETLLQVVESLNRPTFWQPNMVLGFGNQSVLTRRFEMIANPSVRPRAALAATLCLSLLLTSFFCVPVRAEKDAKPTAVDDAKKEAAAKPTKEELKTQSRANVGSIILAMHIYHDKHGAFPPAVLYGKNNNGGKFPHSWRVAILPYLDQQKLYDTYRFDEAWDSPANVDVMAKMPDVYRAPGEERRFLHPAYAVLVGKLMDDDSEPAKLQTMFSSKPGTKISKITDGISNTLAIVETKLEGKQVIQWTEPKDLTYDPAGELPKLGGLYSDGFYMGMANGPAIFINSTTKAITIKALISPAGGEIDNLFNQ